MTEQSGVPLVVRIERAMEVSRENTTPCPTFVRSANQAGITALMLGLTDQAINKYLEALKASTTNEERALSLANIGDYIRRVVGDVRFAVEVLEQAISLADISPVTISRTKAMLAMVRMLETERGLVTYQHQVDQAIQNLREAIAVVHAVSGEDARNAESLAFHRLAGIVCRYGTQEEQRSMLIEIERYLPTVIDELEIARLNYSRALCMVGVSQASRTAATELLMTSARTIEIASPMDACFYYARAGRWYFEEDNRAAAQHCLERAGQFIEIVKKHVNGKRTLEEVDVLAEILKAA